jgi:hypothetical protein
MSEYEPKVHSPERHQDNQEAKTDQQEKLKELIEKAGEVKDRSAEEIAKLASEAKQEAITGKDSKVSETSKDSGHHAPHIINRAVKSQAYKKLMGHIQRQLPKNQRSFSKFVHRPSVEAVSEFSSKTIARPSGLLGSGISALLGSLIVLWVSRHYGFSYNFTVFIGLVVIGFALGLFAESLWRFVRKLAK